MCSSFALCSFRSISKMRVHSIDLYHFSTPVSLASLAFERRSYRHFPSDAVQPPFRRDEIAQFHRSEHRISVLLARQARQCSAQSKERKFVISKPKNYDNDIKVTVTLECASSRYPSRPGARTLQALKATEWPPHLRSYAHLIVLLRQ